MFKHMGAHGRLVVQRHKMSGGSDPTASYCRLCRASQPGRSSMFWCWTNRHLKSSVSFCRNHLRRSSLQTIAGVRLSHGVVKLGGGGAVGPAPRPQACGFPAPPNTSSLEHARPQTSGSRLAAE